MTSVVPMAEHRPAARISDRMSGLPELSDEDIAARDRERERQAKLASLGSMSPADYGTKRDALAEELRTPLTWLDLEYKEQSRRSRPSGGDKPAPKFLEAAEPWDEWTARASSPTSLQWCAVMLS